MGKGVEVGAYRHPPGPGQKELHIAGFRIEPKAKYMYGPVYVPSSWLGTGRGKNDRIRTIEPYREYMDSRRANVVGSPRGLFWAVLRGFPMGGRFPCLGSFDGLRGPISRFVFGV